MKGYQYIESGLDYVYLANGYTIHETPAGSGVSIQAIDGLHRVMANSIITNPSNMRGQDARFLRGELRLSQEAIGRVVGVDRQTVMRWEKNFNGTIEGPPDRVLRLFYAGKVSQYKAVGRICELLEKIDNLEFELKVIEATFGETGDGWQIKKAA